jgi:hypothetical protein
MMPQSFMDKILRRARSATSDADLEMLKDEMEGKVPPDLMNGEENNMDDDQNGIHMHVHLPNGNGNGGGEPPKPDDGALTIQHGQDQGEPDLPGGDIADLAARLAALEQKVSELMDGDESEVELQNPGDIQDAKRYIMRRGSRLKAHDDETIPVPEREPEIIGETDLPGLQNLTSDSVPMELLWQDTMAKGEIIVPGIRIPTFDSRVKAGITAQRLCSFRRQTLDAALDSAEAKEILSGLVGVKTKDQVKTLPCDTLKMAFETTANVMGAQRNNGFIRSSVTDSLPNRGGQQNHNGPMTLGEIQRRNREAWKSGDFKPIH